MVLTFAEPQVKYRWLSSAATAIGFVLLMLAAIRLIQWVAAGTTMSFAQPGGSSRGPDGHAKAESLAVAGLMEDATREFEIARAERGETIALLRAEAELHSTASGDAKRAEELFLRIRRSPDATRSDELYASHRLIDLYVGALNDPGRVLVELRRMSERFPDTVDGEGALAELNRRRAESASN